MTRAGDPAIPFVKNSGKFHSGLTKREYFAGRAMQGILSNSTVKANHTQDELAKVAVGYADYLIEALKEGDWEDEGR